MAHVQAYSSHDTTIIRSLDRFQTATNKPIEITVSFTNRESIDLRGFFFTEQIPSSLTVSTAALRVNGGIVTNCIMEQGLHGDVYSNATPFRWILELPPSFAESNAVPPGAAVELVYSVSSSSTGTFHLSEFSWAGYYSATQECAFGYSEAEDLETIVFLAEESGVVSNIAQIGPAYYDPGGVLTISNTFAFSGDLLSLGWCPVVPEGWTIVALQGDGDPGLIGGEIIWTNELSGSPVEMTYSVNVPLWQRGVAEITAQAAYVLSGMLDPVLKSALPTPLAIQPRDSDMDGLPDGWENHYCGNPTNMLPAADGDGDGMKNLQEHIAGTDPTNRASVFKLVGLFPKPDGALDLLWTSASNRLYAVEKTTNLLESFSTAASNIVAEPPVNEYTDHVGGRNNSYYRLQVAP